MLAYRLIHDVNIFKKRSFCPQCHRTIAWYDNIPIISWLLLLGKCRNCKGNISILYPIIELITTIFLTLLFYQIPINYFFGYFIMFSALIITIRTDLETMLISRYVTIFLIPLSLFFSYTKLIPISVKDSILGSLFGFALLFCISKFFKLITKKDGLGEGDIDLLAFIGSFTGIVGSWLALLIGSILGSIFGILLISSGKLKNSNKIPFGPFLSIGSIVYILFQNEILNLI